MCCWKVPYPCCYCVLYLRISAIGLMSCWNLGYDHGYVCDAWFVEEGREGRDSAFIAMYRSVFVGCCKFPTIENLKETPANFSKIPRVSLFRVPTFLVYAWSSFGSIPTQETRSKRLDVVEAVFTQIWTVLCFTRFSAFAAFKPLRDLKRTCR